LKLRLFVLQVKESPMELDNLAEKPELQPIVDHMATELHQNWGKDFLKER